MQAYWPTARDREAVSRYASSNVSYRVVRDLLAPSEEQRCDEFCEFLRLHSNVPVTANVVVPDVELAAPPLSELPNKPHILIVVVDSLRPDYLSAYNPKVDFTPAIGRFANESIILANAFSNYSGTTVSEPAIWSGVMQLQQHYLQPFRRINSLEKLLRSEQYDTFVSVDTVLRDILEPESVTHPLDWANTDWTGLGFCSTVQQLRKKLGQRNKAKPVFAFTQPTDIHQVTLSRLSGRAGSRDRPGFDARYASELERIDTCFGDLVSFLKRTEIYDNSIVILTSDHGDALG